MSDNCCPNCGTSGDIEECPECGINIRKYVSDPISGFRKTSWFEHSEFWYFHEKKIKIFLLVFFLISFVYGILFFIKSLNSNSTTSVNYLTGFENKNDKRNSIHFSKSIRTRRLH